MLGTANFAFGTYWAWPQHQEVKVGVSHSLHFICGLSVWGVEPVVTHQTSRLESTGVCGVQQNCGSTWLRMGVAAAACLVHQILHLYWAWQYRCIIIFAAKCTP